MDALRYVGNRRLLLLRPSVPRHAGKLRQYGVNASSWQPILRAERSHRKARRGKIGGINVLVLEGADGDRGPVRKIQTC